MIHFGFNANGGFCVVDTDKRIGEFAFPTSPYAVAAKQNQQLIADKMLAAHWENAPQHIREAHYLLSCEELGIDPSKV